VLLIPTLNIKICKECEKQRSKGSSRRPGSDLGKKTLPEPACACPDATLILDLGGKLKIDYSEINITTGDDGSILVRTVLIQNYYIIKDGVSSGPLLKIILH